MARPPFRGRLSRRDRLSANNATFRFAAAATGDPEVIARTERELITPLAPKRDRVKRPVDGQPVVPLEKEVLADVLQALRNDPRVGYVWRQNTGVFQDGDRYIRTGPSGMPDIIGVLAGSGTALFIEVKRRGGKPDERQAQRLEQFRKLGAIAGYATSAEEALALLSK